METCTLQLCEAGVWHDVAVLRLLAPAAGGVAAPTLLGYATDWVLRHAGARDAHALSAALSVSLEFTRGDAWPALVVDLLPQGHGRAELARALELPGGPAADWPLLCAGAGNPIGHLRVKEAHAWLGAHRAHPVRGFTREEVGHRAEAFLDYLGVEGLYVAGSSGVQGEWPKLLLTRARDGLWYLDHALADAEVVEPVIVKFARGADASLATILHHEPIYLELARRLGLRVHRPLTEVGRAVFIPRFDRVVSDRGLLRLAQESLASVCGHGGFGPAPAHDVAVAALHALCTEPLAEVLEFLRRDAVNLALGNKDNHARNTAIKRDFDGHIALTPLYDFVPMLLHPDGIARCCKWQGEGIAGPDWSDVVDRLARRHGLDSAALRTGLRALIPGLREIAARGVEFGVAPALLERLRPSLAAQCDALARLDP